MFRTERDTAEAKGAYRDARDELSILNSSVDAAVLKISAAITEMLTRTGIDQSVARYAKTAELLESYIREDILSEWVFDEERRLQTIMEDNGWVFPSDFQQHNTLNHVQQGTN